MNDGAARRKAKRVDELARDLGVAPVDLLAWLRANGESMKRLASIIDYRAEDRAHAAVARGDILRSAAPARQLQHRPPTSSVPRAGRRQAAKALPHAAARSRLVGYIIDRSRTSGASGYIDIDIAAAVRYEQLWLRNLFDTDETIEWLEAGALPSEAPSAASLRRAGLSPAAACRDVPCSAGGCRLRHSAIGRVSRSEVTADEAVAELRAMGIIDGVRAAESPAKGISLSLASPRSTCDDGAERPPVPMPSFSHSETEQHGRRAASAAPASRPVGIAQA